MKTNAFAIASLLSALCCTTLLGTDCVPDRIEKMAPLNDLPQEEKSQIDKYFRQHLRINKERRVLEKLELKREKNANEPRGFLVMLSEMAETFPSQ